MSGSDRKVVLVTRRTRMQDLLARHHTLAQARFYIKRLGADFSDYEKENEAYSQSLDVCADALRRWGRYQVVERDHLPNFVFGKDDMVVALGQDGVVANTMKYLQGQPLLGVNPEPSRWDGVLLPFQAADVAAVLREVAVDRRPAKAVTMAQATLSDGQRLRAVNDLFIGPRTHSSALYEIELAGHRELQSSSGVIVSTGLGSTAWMKSVVTGSLAIMHALNAGVGTDHRAQPWDSAHLTFAVREPFASRTSRTELVYGEVTTGDTLLLRSRMPENGVIFSDGMEADYLRFTAGMEAKITVASVRGQLIV
jgi:NAD kinase